MLAIKYDILRDRWDNQKANYRSSNLWKGVMSAHESFTDEISFCMGSECTISFWLDTWVGEKPLAVVFPCLFLCARDRYAQVFQYMSRAGDHLQWDSTFRRNLTEEKETEFISLLDSRS